MTRPHSGTQSKTPIKQEVEEASVEDAAKLAPKLIYEVIRRDGEEELDRTTRSLMWSGIAAGVMISFSVVGEAIFRTHLPDTPSRYLIENLGYSLGFLIVILSRMQLFTENTITTVLPVLHDFCWANVARAARVWGVVLGANIIGAFAIAALYVFTPALPDDLTPALMELSRHAMGFTPSEAFFRAIPAGILIAAIVWMVPQAEAVGFFVIIVFTWLIAAGDFTHIVAGSVEMAYLMIQGQLGLWPAVSTFFIPVFFGNVVGGTVVFSIMAYGQVRDEMESTPHLDG
ncbi:formate/nitrite transporter family protein [Pseudooctadecabacter jejudonensis]|uniref:Inner membrane protein YfdC n=1 Tax=Pseudooctadecabacter jejudonensis TaxID=1391910 RepID=A0A1Y5TDV6_9RHOB|nr:formate/nitrite transporter family protein [Pseudooctadecabacter jejudonensis]SLN58088.1 Inner membrane protein YfdC [Pseudooctadecabacter jejudonensis]